MRAPLLRALRQRDFAILWAGQTVSMIGDGIFTVAVAWQALQFRSGAATLGAVLVTRSAARILVLLLGGALADRYQKRLLIILGDTIQMLSIAALAYVTAYGDLKSWQLALAAGVNGAGSAIFLSSSSAMVPELVDEDSFQSANSLRSSSMLLATDMIGPAAGGVLVATVGTAAAFAVDAATFLASIVALAFIRPRRRTGTGRLGERSGTGQEQPAAGLLAEAKEGLRYVRRTPWIWVTLVAVGTVGNFASFAPLVVLVPLLVEQHLGEGAATLGFVFTGYGVGGLLGALTIGSLKLKLTTTVPAYAGWLLGSVGFGALALAPNAITAAAVLAFAGFCAEIGEVVWATLLQKYVPPNLLGRVTSTDWLVSLSLTPVGVALAAPAADAIGVRTTLVAGAVLSVAAMAVAIAFRSVRDVGGPAPASPGG